MFAKSKKTAILMACIFGTPVAAIALVVGQIRYSLITYRLNESHFGRQGAIRWAAAGTIYGLLQQVVLTPIPADFDFRISSILKQIGGDLMWKGLTLIFSYLLALPFFSLIQSWCRNMHKG